MVGKRFYNHPIWAVGYNLTTQIIFLKEKNSTSPLSLPSTPPSSCSLASTRAHSRALARSHALSYAHTLPRPPVLLRTSITPTLNMPPPFLLAVLNPPRVSSVGAGMGMAKEQVRPHRESGRGKGRRRGCGRGHGHSEESHWRGWGRGNQLGGMGAARVGSRGRHGDAGRGAGARRQGRGRDRWWWCCDRGRWQRIGRRL